MHPLDNRTIIGQPDSSHTIDAVWVADPGAAARLLATLTCAFIDDPLVRWLYPEADSYLLHYPAFVRAFGGGAFELGTAWRSEDFAACALWYPPGNEPDEKALLAVIADSVAPGRHAEVFALLEAMGKVHPTEPHWYLTLIGVDATSQGCGVGAMLLRTTLGLCDRDGLPAYLEASNPRNIPFCERHGFRRREALCVGSCPPIVPMWRRPAHGPGSWPGYAAS